jgi:hypothetical protein
MYRRKAVPSASCPSVRNRTSNLVDPAVTWSETESTSNIHDTKNECGLYHGLSSFEDWSDRPPAIWPHPRPSPLNPRVCSFAYSASDGDFSQPLEFCKPSKTATAFKEEELLLPSRSAQCSQYSSSYASVPKVLPSAQHAKPAAERAYCFCQTRILPLLQEVAMLFPS